jgi:cytosine/adenosine deaminase-related metal-dependent hydrolase
MGDSQDHLTLEVGGILEQPGRLPARGASCIRIAQGKIEAIEDCVAATDGTLALAAFANAHDHGRGLRTLAFGALDDALESWIPTLGREPKVSAYHRAAVAFARMAEGGIAATNHSHGYQNEAEALQEAEAVSRAAADVGIRVAFAAPFRDRNLLAYGDQGIFLSAADPDLAAKLKAQMRPVAKVADYLHLVDEIAAFTGPYFQIQYCPVGTQWVSDPSLAAIAEASRHNGRRIHMHLLETRYQREWADHAYPSGLIRRLDELGFLSPRLSVAHGVYLRPDESALLAERGVTVSVNTASNFRLRSGIAPVPDFLAKGTPFGIGLDNQALEDDDDFFREMRLCWLNHRGFGLDDVLSAERLFQAAQTDGRLAVLGKDGGGRLEAGAPADILTIDYRAMTHDVLSERQDPVVNLLTRATRKHIKRLVVGGRVIVEDGRCVSVDLPGLEATLNAQARETFGALPPDDEATVQMRRAVRRYYGCGCHAGHGLTASAV